MVVYVLMRSPSLRVAHEYCRIAQVNRQPPDRGDDERRMVEIPAVRTDNAAYLVAG